MTETFPSDDGVLPSEVVGRRIMEKPGFSISISLDQFEDRRLNDDLSLDRLGVNSHNKEVVKILTPLADEGAASRNLDFYGWFAIHSKKLKGIVLRPDKLRAAEDGVDNPYHAVVSRENFRLKDQAHHFTRSLYYHFKEEGVHVAPIRMSVQSENPTASTPKEGHE